MHKTSSQGYGVLERSPGTLYAYLRVLSVVWSEAGDVHMVPQPLPKCKGPGCQETMTTTG